MTRKRQLMCYACGHKWHDDLVCNGIIFHFWGSEKATECKCSKSLFPQEAEGNYNDLNR